MWSPIAQMFASQFHGEYEHGLDEKGRVIVPMKCRPPVEDGLFLTRGLEGCLWLFPRRVWEMVSSQLEDTRLTYREARLLERMLYSGVEGGMDRQGRLLVPPTLRQYAGLEPGQPVIIVGVKNRLELWNPDRWKAETAVLDDPQSDISQELSKQLRDLGV